MSGYVEQGEVVRNEQIGSDVWIMDIHNLAMLLHCS